MKDPSGSDLETPILGIDKDKFSGEIRPLAGCMEDAQGRGLVPIHIGSLGIDSFTGASIFLFVHCVGYLKVLNCCLCYD